MTAVMAPVFVATEYAGDPKPTGGVYARARASSFETTLFDEVLDAPDLRSDCARCQMSQH